MARKTFHKKAGDEEVAETLTSESSQQFEDSRRRGRASASNRSGRFETQSKEPFDDGWSTLEDLPVFKTEVQFEKPKTIITRNASPDLNFDRSINPYRGCEHGCSYCFARPTHSYMGLSAGLDFETRLFAKPDAAILLKKELARPGYKVKPIAIGTNTDPYQPIEREHKIMRSILEVLAEFKHPVGIVTKSALVTRDIDLLSEMAKDNLVKVALSITSLDHKLSRSMEPRASTPKNRLNAIRKLNEAGIATAVMAAPMIPALNDSELEAIMKAAKEAGAKEVNYILLRLPGEVSDIFREWLLRNHPHKYQHVMNLIKSMRQTGDNDAKFGQRLRGQGPYAKTLNQRYQIARRKLEMPHRRLDLECNLFSPPILGPHQLSLFS